MNWFSRRKATPPVPEIVEAVTVDTEAAREDLDKAVHLRLDAQIQSAQADEAVQKLAQKRIRNGFAPAIEESIIRRYLGGATWGQ